MSLVQPSSAGGFKNPFSFTELQPQGFFRSLVGRANPHNGYVALQNLLAQTNDWSTLHAGHVEAALRQHDVRELDPARAKEIFEKALTHFVADQTITDDETAALRQLRDLLGLRDADVAEVETRVVDPVYGHAIRDVLADERITAEEEARLDRLRRALRIDERKAIMALQAAAAPILKERWNTAVVDRRLSDDEMQALRAMADNFGIEVTADDANQRLIDRFRWFWLIENGTFPEIACGITLQRNEVCHYATPATVLERRTQTKAVRYGGSAVSFRIMKGVYYRAGGYNVQRITEDVIKEVDRGTLYVTSKRIIFDGTRANKTYTYKALFGLVPYSDGIELEKSSGRNPMFRIDDPEYASILIASRLAHQ